MMEIVPVVVEAQFVELMVPLYSYGCANKINKALAHFKGIYSVNVDYKQQKVTIWGICNRNEVLSVIRAKRKGARFWNPDGDHQGLTAPPSPSPSFPSSMISNNKLGYGAGARPYNNLSLNWKAAWKKIFSRSNSF